MSSPDHPVPADPAAPGDAARRVTVHAGRVRPSSPIRVTPSMAAHMAANPPVADDAEPALHFDVPRTVVGDPTTPHGPAAARPEARGDRAAGSPTDDEPTAQSPARATPRHRWWHRLLFWRRTPRPRSGCRLCGWDGDGACPLGHRA